MKRNRKRSGEEQGEAEDKRVESVDEGEVETDPCELLKMLHEKLVSFPSNETFAVMLSGGSKREARVLCRGGFGSGRMTPVDPEAYYGYPGNQIQKSHAFLCLSELANELRPSTACSSTKGKPLRRWLASTTTKDRCGLDGLISELCAETRAAFELAFTSPDGASIRMFFERSEDSEFGPAYGEDDGRTYLTFVARIEPPLETGGVVLRFDIVDLAEWNARSRRRNASNESKRESTRMSTFCEDLDANIDRSSLGALGNPLRISRAEALQLAFGERSTRLVSWGLCYCCM